MRNEKARGIGIFIESGPHTGKLFLLDKSEVFLGRAESNDIVLLDDKTVSSCHARLFQEGSNWVLENRSKNGVYMEARGVRHRLDTRECIFPRQRFLLGKTLLSFNENPDAIATVSNAAHSFQHRKDRLDKRLVARITYTEGNMHWQLLSSDACGTTYTCSYCEEDVDALNRRLRSVICSVNEPCFSPEEDSNDYVLHRKLDETLHEVGAFLRDHFLPIRIREKLREADSDTLFLQHEGRFIDIPWELALVDNEPLSLQFSLGRQVVLEDYSAEFKRQSEPGQTRLLIISNPTDDLPNAQKEAEVLFEMIRRSHPEIHVDFLGGPRVERVSLLSRLEQTDIAYFVGHAEYDERDPIKSGWPLSKGFVSTRDFRNLRNPPALVFANGCETGRETNWSDPRRVLKGNHGTASAFILAGVQHYVGAVWPISADSSTAFAGEFLSHLLRGQPIGKCIQKARKHILAEFGKNDLVWASYVLYGDPAQAPIRCN